MTLGSRREHAEAPTSERLQTLVEISRAVSATLDLSQLYDTIYQQVGRVMDTTRFFIALHRPERGVFEIPYHREDGELFVDQEVPLGNSVTAHVVEHGRPLLFSSAAEYAGFAETTRLPQLFVGDNDSESMIFVPLNTESSTIGALTVQSTEPGIYSADDLRTLSVIASQAAVAIENARLFSAQNDRVTELQSIQSLVHALIALHDVPEIAGAIDRELKRLIDYHSCRIFVLDPAGEILVPVTTSDAPVNLRVGEGVAGWIARYGTPVLIADTLQDSRMKYIEGTPVREESMIGAPLIYEGKVRGVIQLTKLGRNEFDANALRLLEIVAGQAAIVLDRARIYDQLRTEASTDPLTKLYNRRFLMDRFAEERRRAARNGHILGAIMLDIDKFKRINDTYGHGAGDAVLSTVAQALRSIVRAEDIVARLGGGEFCVLLPETSIHGAQLAAERVRAAVASSQLPPEAGVERVTVSVGLALLQSEDRSTEVFTRADRALYRSKHSGGNCVCLDAAEHVHFLDQGESSELSPESTAPAWLSTQRLDSFLADLPLVAVALDLAGAVLYANPTLLHLTGYSLEDLWGSPWNEICRSQAGGDVPISANQQGGTRRGAITTKAGSERVFIWNTIPLHDERQIPVGMLSIGEDVTERQGAEGAGADRSLYDPLTALPNRTLFHDRLRQALLAARRDGSPCAVLLMDIDRFKELNETMGHAHGDEALQQVGDRLRTALRESDTVARLGGDEFAMVLPGTDTSATSLVANKVLRLVEQPVTVAGESFDIAASIGIAVYPDHGDDGATMLRHAEIAMYAAKRLDGGYELYDPEQDRTDAPRLLLTGQLRRAIGHNQLVLHYQPKIDLRNSSLSGVEALVRWRHPEQGLIMPDRFVPLAEHTGLIKPLGLWVLNAALLQARHWNAQGMSLGVAVNLSARHIHDEDLVGGIEHLLALWQIESQCLTVEVTESAVMADPDKAIGVLSALHAMSVRISIDDFGTGYSSLAYLKRLPVHELKIDRSFVRDMMVSDNDAFIVKSIIDLGHNLGLDIVAEGVETVEALIRLGEMGCDRAQGYCIARPMESTDLRGWMTSSPLLGGYAPG